jgi:S1-C subfamily serine protease
MAPIQILHSILKKTLSTFLRAIPSALIVLTIFQASHAKDFVAITTNPPGATVELDGIVVGKTPYRLQVPGGYLHGTKSVFGKVLRQQIHLRLSLDGYLPVDADLAKGPMPWIALNGTYHGDYWLLKTANFAFSLQRAATMFTGNVQTTTGGLQSVSLRPALPTEEIVRIASSAVLLLRSSEGTGSGFLVTSTGVAVTNAHVARGQTTLAATTFNGQTFNAKVEYIDPVIDLALIRLEGTNFSRLVVADLSTVQQGTGVVAIGNPSQGLQNTVTKGIVSAVGPMPDEPGIWIQTDAAINPGNSGGPLLNSAGEVIGITTQKKFQSSDRRPLEGIGFALSSEDLLSVLRRFYPSAGNDVSQATHSSQGGSGVLAVSSDAEAADIFVDDKFVGNTPSRLTLDSGAHIVRLEAANRATWTREVNLLKDSNVSLKATLVAALPINLSTQETAPTVTQVAPSQSAVQPRPIVVASALPLSSEQHLESTTVLAGNHGVSSQGNEQLKSPDPATGAVRVETPSAWEIKEHSLSDPSTARITITSAPSPVEMFVDSRGVGRTPNSLDVQAGKHTIQLVLNGYKDQVREITARPGYEVLIRVDMQK